MELRVKVVDSRLSDLVNEILASDNISDQDKLDLREAKQNSLCTVRTLRLLKNYYGDRICLHQWLCSGELILPSPPKRERNPELLARLEKLRNEQANKEYMQMTRNVDAGCLSSNGTFSLSSFAREYAAMNRQLVMLFNTVLTVVCTFFVVYFGLEYVADIAKNNAFRLLFSTIAATVVFMCDLYFIAKTLQS
ncbi:transmembrane protein 199 [Trichuris trichiura]|uniref:Transmembrane protein 199 n=1 Tax=Trichuris trichiura TaxID=36087 RepID=A0A077ZKU4_TRITR|nr:transmembrane protein 199 [Trichuris trichiura]